MIIHKVKVYPSKIHLPKKNQLAWIIAEVASDNVKLNKLSIEIKKFVKENQISFLVVGPEEPLVNGIVDYFEKENIKIFGPNKISAQLEGSKIFTK